MNSDKNLTDRLELARRIALEAGRLTLRYFQGDSLNVELKGDASPVTIADRQAEELLRQRIAEAFPRDAILGEEFPEKQGDSGYRWILDPIDGTKSFIAGVPLYGTLIGVEHQGKSVVGVIEMPGLDERIFAAVGQGAWHVRGEAEPVRARVSGKERLEKAIFCTSEVKTYYKVGREEAYRRLDQGCWVGRTWGDCYGYLLVATGRIDLMVDPVMNVWDCAALQPVLEEAGGTFTDWQGAPTIHSGEAIATNGKILAEVLNITKQFPSRR